MDFDCGMDEKQKELAGKFQDHLDERYGKKVSLEEAHIGLKRLAKYVTHLAEMKRDQESRGIFIDDDEDSSP